jgi:glycerophosphoryl diester phosphodiesterase
MRVFRQGLRVVAGLLGPVMAIPLTALGPLGVDRVIRYPEVLNVSPPSTVTPVRRMGARPLHDCAAVLVIAHRGATDPSHTENTVEAGRRAQRLRTDVIEGDLQLTRDQRWVLLHDSTVDRTTQSSGRIRDRTAGQAGQIRMDDGHLGIATISRFLESFRADPRIQFHLEVKPLDASSAQLRRLLRVFTTRGIKDRLLITSYGRRALLAIHHLDPTWHTALISDRASTRAAVAARFGEAIVAQQSVVTADYLRRMHRVGLKVYPWDVNARDQWARLVRAGADGLVTSHVGWMRDWCRAAH